MKQLLEQFSNNELAVSLLKKVKLSAKKFYELHGRKPIFMEVCGTHTHAFAKTGVRTALKDCVTLISGPGCPVCVTDQGAIDAMIELACESNAIICTFGDMMRVPGTDGLTLYKAKMSGKDIRVLYSPLDAVAIAQKNPTREVIFLSIGFETTIPLFAAALQQAERLCVNNFSLWMNTKLLEPIFRHLLAMEQVSVDAFVLPGHVSIVLGKDYFHFLTREYGVSGVIMGFEVVELLGGMHRLIKLATIGKPKILNEYPSVVKDRGNEVAKSLMYHYFTEVDEAWRGIGVIGKSGLDCKDEFSHFNAKTKFKVKRLSQKPTKCRCGEVICGVIEPPACPLFKKSCHPENPIGPCMVSSEGTCAAYYHYID